MNKKIKEIGFTGCGMSMYFQAGCAIAMHTHDVVDEHTKIMSCSGGTFSLCVLRHDGDIGDMEQNLYDHWERFCDKPFYEKLSMNYRIDMLRESFKWFFEEVTCKHIIHSKNNYIMTTHLKFLPETVLHNEFRSVEHFYKVMCATCAIPLFSGFGKDIDGERHVDGGFLSATPSFSDDTIIISPFKTITSIATKNKCIVPPITLPGHHVLFSPDSLKEAKAIIHLGKLTMEDFLVSEGYIDQSQCIYNHKN